MQKNFLYFMLLCCLTSVVTCDEAEEQKPIILLLLGPPGSGRDVLAVKVTSSFSIPYISTADLLLDASDDESDTGRQTRDSLQKGSISDELLLRLITDRVKRPDCAKGFLLDGFPKSSKQAQELNEQFHSKFRVLPAYLRTSDEWLINFHEGRLVCTNCGRVYHLDRSPPRNEDLCDLCGYELIQRHDDCPETLKKRTEGYRECIMPLLTYYRQEKLLVEIDGNRSLDEMFQDVKLLLVSQRPVPK
jgi:adenylate kinase